VTFYVPKSGSLFIFFMKPYAFSFPLKLHVGWVYIFPTDVIFGIRYLHITEKRNSGNIYDACVRSDHSVGLYTSCPMRTVTRYLYRILICCWVQYPLLQITVKPIIRYNDWLRAGTSGFDSRYGKEIFLYSAASRPALGYTQSCV
jgi:hypothetical protein